MFTVDPAAVATTSFSITPGQYRVSVTWPENASYWATNARHEVLDGSTPRGAVTLNQRLAPDDLLDLGFAWEHVGVFNIAGSTLRVRLSAAGADGYVIADGVRIERVGDVSPGPEIQVTEDFIDIPPESGTADFGTTDLSTPVTKTFTISNYGSQPLILTAPISVPPGYTLVTGPASGFSIIPGNRRTLTVRLDAQLPGTHTGQISIFTNDNDNSVFNFTVTGTVLPTRIIDDDPGFPGGYGDGPSNSWATLSGAGRNGDFRYSRNVVGSETAMWTFNVTAGQYRVSATWPFGSTGYDDTARFIVFNGDPALGDYVGGRNLNQQADPDDRFTLGSWWEDVGVVSITGTLLAVQLRADDPLLFALADSVLIERLGEIPAGPEVVVSQDNRDATIGTDYGTTQLNRTLDRTFKITNSGMAPLTVDPASFTMPDGYQLINGPSLTTINPGEQSTFVVRLTAADPGTKAGAITFTTNDTDEGVINLDVSGEVLPYRIIDDQDTADGYSQTGMISAANVMSYRGDASYADIAANQGPASATWTFTNLSPGTYYVGLTWLDSDGNPLLADNTPVTVLENGTPLLSFTLNQEDGPEQPTAGSLGSVLIDGATWQTYGVFVVTGPTVTVTMTNQAEGTILADGVLLYRTGD
ncbi:MAG: choice-of-anchor D domain-containing protein [Planctomycetes bacterium]|nr:choice-of-anchor D domain-containing protein [Planctomycetota bacterium]